MEEVTFFPRVSLDFGWDQWNEWNKYYSSSDVPRSAVAKCRNSHLRYNCLSLACSHEPRIFKKSHQSQLVILLAPRSVLKHRLPGRNAHAKATRRYDPLWKCKSTWFQGALAVSFPPLTDSSAMGRLKSQVRRPRTPCSKARPPTDAEKRVSRWQRV